MEELIDRFKNGNVSAYNSIVKKVKKKLYAIAMARLGNEEDAEDAVQDTLIQIYKNINSLKDINKFNSWMTTILINKCNAIYSLNKKVVVCDQNELDNFFENKNDFNSVDENMDFFHLINILSIGDRTIITMYYSDGYTIKDISEILNLNENTVKSKIKRSKESIKYMLQKGEKYG